MALFVIAASYEPALPALWLVIGLGIIGAVVVLFRRRRPVLMFAAANVLALVSSAAGTSVEALLPLITVYAVGVYRSTRAAWVCFGAGAAASALFSLTTTIRIWVGPPILEPAQAPNSGDFVVDWLNNTVATIVVLLVATLIGTNVGGRKRYVAALLDRAAQLVRERDQQAEIAGARERERIAREMHDVIAHSLSVMIALSEGAAAASRERPEQARDAIARVAETGRRTLTEVRRLLGAVRADASAGTDLAPQPGAARLPELVEEFRRAGLPVQLTLQGAIGDDAALGLTVYRIVQESLTNALRHARGATRVEARVVRRADHLEIVVEDDAPVPSSPAEPGRGILGIRERAALWDGEVEAGEQESGGWRVSVRLPRTGESS